MEHVFVVMGYYESNQYCEWEESDDLEGIFASREAAKAFIEREHPEAVYNPKTDCWVEEGTTEYYEYINRFTIAEWKVES